MKYRNKIKKVTRILACLMAVMMLLSQFSTLIFAANENSNEVTKNVSRQADPASMDTYKENLNLEENSQNAGRLWSDKTVLGYDYRDSGDQSLNWDSSSNKLKLDEQTDGVSGEIKLDSDFLHVYSALGSSQKIVGVPPVRTVIVFDNSSTMYCSANSANSEFGEDDEALWKSQRIALTVESINRAIDALMMKSQYNEVSVVLFGDGANNGTESVADDIFRYQGNSTAVTILPMKHYTPDSTVQQNYNDNNLDANEYTHYLEAGWDNGTLPSGDSPNHEGQTGGKPYTQGWVYVNNTISGLKAGSEGSWKENGFNNCGDKNYTTYRNGTTNIQAGYYVGMQELLKASKTEEVAGEVFNCVPSLVMLTDGQATDMLSGNFISSGENGIPESRGFVNDPSNKLRSYIGYENLNSVNNSKELANLWDMFVQYSSDESQTKTFESVANKDGYSTKNTGLTDPANNYIPDENSEEKLIEVADQYSDSIASMLLGTLMTTAYYKQLVKQEYNIEENSNWDIYTVSVDMIEPDKEINSDLIKNLTTTDENGIKKELPSKWKYDITSSAPTMDPSTYFEDLSWLQNKGFLENTVTVEGCINDPTQVRCHTAYPDYSFGEMIIEGIFKAKNYLNQWNTSEGVTTQYRSWKEVSGILKQDENNSNPTYKDETNGIEWDSTKYCNPWKHSNGYLLQDPQTIEYPDLEDDKNRITKDLVYKNINYSSYCYYPKTANGTAQGLTNVFVDIIDQIMKPLFEPVNGQNDLGVQDAVTFKDPMGKYMEVKDVKNLSLFGELYDITRTAVYDYEWNDLYMNNIDKGDQSFQEGWYKGEPKSKEQGGNSEVEDFTPDKENQFPENCENADEAWKKGWVYRLGIENASKFVPSLQTISDPSKITEQQKKTEYTFYRIKGYKDGDELDELDRSILRLNPAYKTEVNSGVPEGSGELITEGKYKGEQKVDSNSLEKHLKVPGVYALSDLRIWVEDTGDYNESLAESSSVLTDSNFDKSLNINIPNNMLPLRTATIDYGQKSDEFVNQWKYTTNQNKGSIGYEASLPLRVFYSVGVEDELKAKDGTIDLASKVSQEYIQNNKISDQIDKEARDVPINGVEFFSNWYNPSNRYDYSTGTRDYTFGDPIVSFSPNESNQFYQFQDAIPLFKINNIENQKDDDNDGIPDDLDLPNQDVMAWAKDKGFTLVENPDEMTSEDLYWAILSYYKNTDGKCEKILKAVARYGKEFGSGVGDGTVGHYLCWYNTGTEGKGTQGETRDFALGKPIEDGTWVVAVKKGGIRLGGINKDVKTKGKGSNFQEYKDVYVNRKYPEKDWSKTWGYYQENTTRTANNRYLPTVSTSSEEAGGKEDVTINVYLGNNGRLWLIDTTLLMTKQVVPGPGGQLPENKDYEFNYQIYIDNFTNQRTAVRVQYDETTKKWVRQLHFIDLELDSKLCLQDSTGNKVIVDKAGNRLIQGTANSETDSISNDTYLYLNDCKDIKGTDHSANEVYDPSIDNGPFYIYIGSPNQTNLNSPDTSMRIFHNPNCEVSDKLVSEELIDTIYYDDQNNIIPVDQLEDVKEFSGKRDFKAKQVSLITINDYNSEETNWNEAINNAPVLTDLYLATLNKPDEEQTEAKIESPYKTQSDYLTQQVFFGYKKGATTEKPEGDVPDNPVGSGIYGEPFESNDDLFINVNDDDAYKNTAEVTLKSNWGLLFSSIPDKTNYLMAEKLDKNEVDSGYSFLDLTQIRQETPETKNLDNTKFTNYVYPCSGDTGEKEESVHYRNTWSKDKTETAINDKPVSTPEGNLYTGVQQGDKITYKIDWANTGENEADVSITDQLDKGVYFTNASIVDSNNNETLALNSKSDNSSNSIKSTSGLNQEITYSGYGNSETDHTVTWDLGKQQAGSYGSVLLTVTVNEHAVEYWNYSEDENPDKNDYLVRNQGEVRIGDNLYKTNIVENPADVSDKKEFTPGEAKTVEQGDYIAYQIDWVNYDNQNKDIIITDKLDKGVNFIGAYEGTTDQVLKNYSKDSKLSWNDIESIDPNIPGFRVKSQKTVTEEPKTLEPQYPDKENEDINNLFDKNLTKENSIDPIIYSSETTQSEGIDASNIKYQHNLVTAGTPKSEQTVIWELNNRPSIFDKDNSSKGRGSVTLIVQVNSSAEKYWDYNIDTNTTTENLVPSYGYLENDTNDNLVRDQALVQVKDHPAIATRKVENPLKPEKEETDPGADGDVHVGQEITYQIDWHNTTIGEDGRPTKAKVEIVDPLDIGVDFVRAYYDPDMKLIGDQGDSSDDDNIELKSPDESSPENFDSETQSGITYNSESRTVTWNIQAEPRQDGVVLLTVRVNKNARKKWDYDSEEDPSKDGIDMKVVNRASIHNEAGVDYTNKVENPVLDGFNIRKNVISSGNKVTDQEFAFKLTLDSSTEDSVNAVLTIYNADGTKTKDSELINLQKEEPKEVKIKKGQWFNVSGLEKDTRVRVVEETSGLGDLIPKSIVWSGDNNDFDKIDNGIILTVGESDQEISFVCSNIYDEVYKVEDTPGDGEGVVIGQEITYSIGWSNNTSEVQDIIIYDPLDIGLTPTKIWNDGEWIKTNDGLPDEVIKNFETDDSGKTTPYTYNGYIVWKLGQRQGGESGTVSFKARVNDQATVEKLVQNIASVKVGESYFQTNKPENPVKTPEKEEITPGNKQGVTPGQEITYSISWENTLDEKQNITIVDPIFEGVDFVTASDDYEYFDEKTITDQNVLELFENKYNYKGYVRWILKDCPAHSSGKVTLTVRVNSHVYNYENVLNQAFVENNGVWYKTSIPENPPDKPTKRETDPQDGNTVAVGKQIDYQISVKNSSDLPKNITVIDPIDKGLDFVSASHGSIKIDHNNPRTTGISTDNQQEVFIEFLNSDNLPAGIEGLDYSYDKYVKWTLYNVPAGMNRNLDLSCIVNESAIDKGIVKDQAFANYGNSWVPTEEPVNPLGGPKKTEDSPGDGNKVVVGQQVSYKIHWENYQIQEAEVIVTDQLDPGVDFVSAGIEDNPSVILNSSNPENKVTDENVSISYEPVSRTVTWTLGIKEAGSSGNVLLNVTVNEDAFKFWQYKKQDLGSEEDDNIIYNQAEVQIGQDPKQRTNIVENPLDKDKPEKEEITPGPGKTVNVGDEVSHTISWKNNKKTEATVTVKDKLDPGCDFVEASFDGVTLKANNLQKSVKDTIKGITISYDPGTHTVTWTLEKRQPGESNKVAIIVEVNENATYEWNYDNPDLNTDKQDNKLYNKGSVKINDDPDVETNVVENPTGGPKKVELTPGDGETVKVGEEIEYQIFWENYTNETADITIKDPLDPGLDYVDGSASHGGTYKNHTLTWTLKDQPAGAVGSVRFKATVNEKAYYTRDGKSIDGLVYNDGTVQVGNNPEQKVGTPENPLDPWKDEVPDNNHPAEGDYVQKDQEIVYDIYYANDHNEAADVTITDKLADYFTFVEAKYGDLTLTSSQTQSSLEDGSKIEFDSSTNSVTWTIKNVPQKTGGKVTLKVKVNEKADNLDKKIVQNQAFVQVGQDPQIGTNIPENPTGGPHKIEETPGDGKLVGIGDIITYRVTWENNKETAAKITIRDPLDLGVDYIDKSASDGGVYNAEKHEITWDLGEKEAGEKGSVTFQVKVNEKAQYTSVQNSTEVDNLVKNVAYVKVGNDNEQKTEEPENPLNPGKVETSPGDGKTVQVGDLIDYEIYWSNDLEEPATVTVEDPLDPGVDFVSADNGGTYDKNSHTVTWNLGQQPAQKNGLLHLTVQVNENAKKYWSYDDDRGLVDGSEDNVVFNRAKVTVGNKYTYTNVPENPVGGPEKEEVKPGNNELVKVGDEITYKITWTNYKDEAADIVIKDPLDQGVDFVSADNGGTYDKDSHTVTWTIKQAEARSTGEVELVVKVNQDAYYDWNYSSETLDRTKRDDYVYNRASVKVGNDNEQYTEIPQNPLEDQEPHKTEKSPGDKQIVGVGETITYEIDYVNNTDKVQTVRIYDPLDKGLTFKNATEGGKYIEDGNDLPANVKVDYETHGYVYWEIPNVPAYGSGKVSLTVEVNSDATIKDLVKNQAYIEVNNQFTPTEDPENPTGPYKDEVTPGNKKPVTVGEQITYQIHWNNDLDREAKVVISDPLDPGVDFVSASYEDLTLEATQGSVKSSNISISYDSDSRTVTWDLGNRSAHDQGVVTLVVSVNDKANYKWEYIPDSDEYKTPDEFEEDQMVYNRAKVTVDNHSSYTNIPENPVGPGPEKEEVSPGEGKPVGIGQIIKYEINWYNNENETADITIRDLLDEGVNFIDAGYKDGYPKGLEPEYNEDTRVVTWVIKDQPAGASGIVTLEVEVNDKAKFEWSYDNPELGEGTDNIVHNQASVQVGNHEEVKTKIVDNPVDEEPHKTEETPGDKEQVKVGDEITYRVLWDNDEQTSADVAIRDPLDKGVDFVSADFGTIEAGSISQNNPSSEVNGFKLSYDSQKHEVNWLLPSQPAGAYGYVVLKVRVNEGAETKVDNTAYVNVGNKGEVQTETVTNPLEAPKIEIEKWHKKEGTAYILRDHFNTVGEKITYKLVVRDTGKKEAENIILTDSLPETITPIDGSFTYQRYHNGEEVSGNVNPQISATGENKTRLVWNLGDMNLGDYAVITLSFIQPDDEIDTWWINHASVTYDNIEEDEDLIKAAEAQDLEDSNFAVEDQAQMLTAKSDQSNLNHDSHAFDNIEGKKQYHSDMPTEKLVKYSADVRETIINRNNNGKEELSPGADEEVGVGQLITYQIDYTNFSSTSGTVEIVDPLDVGVDFVSASNNGTYIPGQTLPAGVQTPSYNFNGYVYWSIPDVPAGTSGNVTLTVRVNENALDKNVVTDQASIKDPNNDNWSQTNPVENPLGGPHKEETVPGDDVGVKVGQQITYKITYENDTDNPAKITIVDPVDVGLTPVTMSNNGQYIQDNNLPSGVSSPDYTYKGYVLWTIDNVPAHATGVVTLVAEVNNNAIIRNVVDNIAYVQVGNGPFVPTEEPENPLSNQSKTEVSPGNGVGVSVGQTITYQISYLNNTGSAAPVTVVEPVDVGLTYNRGSAQVKLNGSPVSATETVSYNRPEGTPDVNYEVGQYITWVIADVPAGQGGTITFNATVNDQATPNREVDNQAFVKVADGPFQSTDEMTNPLEQPNVIIEKWQQAFKPDGTPYSEKTKDEITMDYVPGNSVTYFITVRNTSTVAAHNVVVTDPIPAGLQLIPGTVTDNGTVVTDSNGVQVLQWTIPELKAGAVEELSVEFSCLLPPIENDPVTYRNIAYVSYDEHPGPTPSNVVVLKDPPPESSTNSSSKITRTTRTTRSTTKSTSPKTGVENAVIPVLITLILLGVVLLAYMIVKQIREQRE